MLISRGRNPSAGEIITQLFSNEELRGRVFTTLGLLLIVRLGIYIPMPGIDREAFKTFIDQGGQLIGFLDIFTGGGILLLYLNWKIYRKMKEKQEEGRLLKSLDTSLWDGDWFKARFLL